MSTININNAFWARDTEHADKYKHTKSIRASKSLALFMLYSVAQTMLFSKRRKKRWNSVLLVFMMANGNRQRRPVDNNDLDLVESSKIEEWPHRNNRMKRGVQNKMKCRTEKKWEASQGKPSNKARRQLHRGRPQYFCVKVSYAHRALLFEKDLRN